MRPKEFPAEKLELIARKTPEELRQFVSSIPRGDRARVLGVLPNTPGFRKNSPAGLEQSLRRLIGDLSGFGAPREKARLLWAKLWLEWMSAHRKLNAVLVEFDNSADFVEVKGGAPPNTELDIDCFKFLAHASHEGGTFREEIRGFYDFGYFLPDDRIERLIEDARPEHEIPLVKRLNSPPETVSELRVEVTKLGNDAVHNDSLVAKIAADLANQGRLLEGLTRTVATTSGRLHTQMAALKAGAKATSLLVEVKNLGKSVQETRESTIALAEDIERMHTASRATSKRLVELGERLDVLAAGFDESIERLRNELDKKLTDHQPPTRQGNDRDQLEVEERADPASLVLQVIDPEVVSRLADNLRTVGLNATSAKILSKEVLAGLHAGQLVMFSGSAAQLIAGACAVSLAGHRHFGVHIPVGLLDGIEVGRTLAGLAVRVESDGLILAVLEGINRSAPEAYADHLRALLGPRLRGKMDGLLLVGTLLDGPSTLPIAPELCEMGPIFDTDLMSWSETPPLRALSSATVSPDSWRSWRSASTEEIRLGDDWNELRAACEGPPDVLWRQSIRGACCGLVAAGAGEHVRASLCFGWLLPRAIAVGAEFDATARALLDELANQDKRISQLLLVRKLIANDD